MRTIEDMVKIIEEEIRKFGAATHDRVFLAIEKRDIPGLVKGEKYDVSFRIKNRRYNAYLFTYYVSRDEDAIIVEWGEESFTERSPELLRKRIRSITEYPTVLNSRQELLHLYEESPKRGTVKTIDFDTLGGHDFEISVAKNEFEKFENAYNQGDVATEIMATELEDSVLPGRFVPQLSAQYKYLEMNGSRAHIDKIEKRGSLLILTLADVH